MTVSALEVESNDNDDSEGPLRCPLYRTFISELVLCQLESSSLQSIPGYLCQHLAGFP